MQSRNFAAANEIRPQGWLKRQLMLQADGLCGHLDKIWPDVRDSAWIGGGKEGWERVPYWLDGFIPLAWLLDDEDLKARAGRYIDAILSFQRPDGWLCPCKDGERARYDTWALQLISKVLVVYYECSGDERVPDALYRCMRNYYALLKSGEIRLFDWGKYRWFETFIALNFLYARYGEDWIADLARLLRAQGFDYETACRRWTRPKRKWRYDTHVVNLAMMLKEEAVTAPLLGGYARGKAGRLWAQLDRYNGTPVGTFTGDECLAGLSPTQGTELCAVAELMYSYALLYAATGDPKWAELLELAGFNALPAALSDDMWAHQYVQMANQIACQKLKGRPIFMTNSGESHLFGLEPNFGCCTANFSQAFPKLALSAFLKDGGDILNAVPLPAVYEADSIRIVLETEYPFKNELHYRIVSDRDFVLKLRVPHDAQYRIRANEPREIHIQWDAAPKITERPRGLFSVRYGALVFCVPIAYEKRRLEYTKDGVERKFPYCDYEYRPKSEWQYALSGDAFAVVQRAVGDIPFSSAQPPLAIQARADRIRWGHDRRHKSVCAKFPRSTKPLGPPQQIELVPYGCAKLRVTQLPQSRRWKKQG